MDEPRAPPSDRIGAATTALDRGWGRATQSIEGNIKPFSLADLVAMSMKVREEGVQPSDAKLIEAPNQPSQE